MLELKNFSYAFGENPVLRGISLKLAEGGYLSIIGPNGAGKSTLLKCILRLHEQGRKQGGILVGGIDISEYKQRELARMVAYVPQAGGWIPPYTVEEFLRLSRYPYSSLPGALNSHDEEAVERALALTGMSPFAKRLLQRLSGGERQKAYLAAALAQESAIMLLDEPTSFLDPRHSAELNALLRKLRHEEKLTMLTVTHDLNHPLDMGGEVLVLRGGRQLFYGPATELMNEGILENAYQHRFSRFRHPHGGQPVIMAEQIQAGQIPAGQRPAEHEQAGRAGSAHASSGLAQPVETQPDYSPENA